MNFFTNRNGSGEHNVPKRTITNEEAITTIDFNRDAIQT